MFQNGKCEDPRLNAFKKEWFEARNCLDIGCSSGILTINIAKKFSCQSMLGIDIDPDQVEEANLNLGKVVELESTEKKRKRDQTENLEQGIDDEEIPTRNLSDIVSFKQENFLESEYNPLEQHYDTILCLSVTLWIHLNWGDDGLKTLFQKIWNMLLPNGLFVLEPHKWKTYEHNRNISEVIISLPCFLYQKHLLYLF
ncbi:putative RNA methyltransferase bin3, bin3-type S-adenosyl-L-methionine binding protein [Lupinus albus]|uniref:RNA methyltransferase n=1 Tax=Lupinus albus TaxID=3870 RepID=A0A6A4NBD5_LUPAL|nr:putative RNA methyltransferase bin3, bin3-type S-adenosyl-L-methionine binding protein [Lupinus albus]